MRSDLFARLYRRRRRRRSRRALRWQRRRRQRRRRRWRGDRHGRRVPRRDARRRRGLGRRPWRRRLRRRRERRRRRGGRRRRPRRLDASGLRRDLRVRRLLVRRDFHLVALLFGRGLERNVERRHASLFVDSRRAHELVLESSHVRVDVDGAVFAGVHVYPDHKRDADGRVLEASPPRPRPPRAVGDREVAYEVVRALDEVAHDDEALFEGLFVGGVPAAFRHAVEDERRRQREARLRRRGRDRRLPRCRRRGRRPGRRRGRRPGRRRGRRQERRQGRRRQGRRRRFHVLIEDVDLVGVERPVVDVDVVDGAVQCDLAAYARAQPYAAVARARVDCHCPVQASVLNPHPVEVKVQVLFCGLVAVELERP